MGRGRTRVEFGLGIRVRISGKVSLGAGLGIMGRVTFMDRVGLWVVIGVRLGLRLGVQ